MLCNGGDIKSIYLHAGANNVYFGASTIAHDLWLGKQNVGLVE